MLVCASAKHFPRKSCMAQRPAPDSPRTESGKVNRFCLPRGPCSRAVCLIICGLAPPRETRAAWRGKIAHGIRRLPKRRKATQKPDLTPAQEIDDAGKIPPGLALPGVDL